MKGGIGESNIGCGYFQLGGLIAPFPQQGIGSIALPPLSADTSNTSESIFYWFLEERNYLLIVMESHVALY